MRGKLSKEEQKKMKESHKDIGWMLAPPTPEARHHEGVLERETESMEVVGEAKEERL